MSRLFVLGCAVICLGGTLSAQEVPEFPKPTKEHEWLQQLTGSWTTEAEMLIPGGETFKTQGTEEVRSVGGFWTIAENKGDFMGQPFLGVMTLGYDPQKQRYVGTWTDSMSSYLWVYEGRVDDSGKVLTLETEGPCPMAPGTTSKFREVLEIKSKDHKVFSSSIQDESGKWTTMMTIHYHRAK